ncbi:MAG TPA: protein phosphatase 2C domain-containing protein [Gemmatimonadales bacterium]|nr:protein phosphatase 2C domain-containing protein [Gemmatimonadales bacterium]
MTTVAGPADIPNAPPAASDIDVFGLTHPGKVRTVNQDQFLIASLHKALQVHHTSMPREQLGDLVSESRGYFCMVADGVGGRPGGERASGAALQAIAEWAVNTMRFHYHHDALTESAYLRDLTEAVLQSHAAIRVREAGTATTLTMVMFRWPRAYLVHVGDSRCYRLRDGTLEQLSKDQTMAQVLVDAGVLPPGEAGTSRWKNVLSSALGAGDALPATSVHDHRWDDVMLLCTDGLTKHVSDAEIREVLASVKSSESICRLLIDTTLSRGATDNVTVVVGRLRERNV